MILVTGATGHVGSELIAQLSQRGERVRAMTRRPGQAKLPRSVEAVYGDFNAPETLATALEGVRRIFLMTVQSHAADPVPTHDRLMAQAARRAGVEHIVKLSVLGAGERSDEVLVRWHRQAEAAVFESGLKWTLLRPGRFMSNALAWAETIRREGKVTAAFGARRATPIDPADVAAVALRALTEPGHEAKVHELSGPEVLTPVREVEILGESLGRALQFSEIPIDVARAGMLRAGMSAESVAAIIARALADDSGCDVLPTVERVTGRPARTFKEWALAHLDAFRA